MTIKLVTERTEYFESIGWTEFATIKESIDYFVGKHEIAYDSETSGLGFMFSKMHSIQVGDDECQFVVDLESIDIEEYRKLLTTKTLIGHNLMFDLVFLYAKNIYPYKIYDTFLAESCLSLGIKTWTRTLDSCLLRHINVVMDKGMQKEAIHGLISYEAIQYAGLDVAFLHRLKKAQGELVKKRELEDAVDLQCKNIMAVAYIEKCGIYINKDELMKWIRRNEYEEYKTLLELNEFVKKEYPSLITEDFSEVFNWESSQQVIELFDRIGIQTFDSKTQKKTVEDKFIKKQIDKFPIIDLYLRLKKYTKIVSTYGRNWFDYIMEDGRIHTKFKPLVDTGRMSCGATKSGPFPNIQNVIADNDFRKIFQAKKGNVLIKCDYSGQESVILADFSKEPKLLEFYKKGEADMHSYVAKMIYHEQLKDLSLDEIKKLHPKLRQNSKSTNFAIAYGGNGFTIAENANIPVKEGEAIYENYFKAFPDLKKYFDNCYKYAMEKGYVLINPVSKLKRYIYGFRDYKKRNMPDPRFENTVFKMALNSPCQGTGGDMTKHACYMFFDWLKQEKLLGKVLMVNVVHDEIVVDCSLRLVDKISDALQACMETAGNLYLTELNLKAEPEVNYCWKK